MLTEKLKKTLFTTKMKLAIRLSVFMQKTGLAKKESIFYVGGAESLPPPLSPEEEAELLNHFNDNEADVKTKLIEHNLRLVVYIAKKFESTGVMMDDLVSIGTIGLIKAINTFAPDKNIKLATYASRCVENEILMYLRRYSKQKAEVSIDEPLKVDWDGNELMLSDVLGSDPNVVYGEIEEEVDREVLSEALSKLNSREKQIMDLRFGLDGGKEFTQKEVADMLGISQSYISRLEKKILERLRKEILQKMG
jgi:RNA polymerase sporulation-specific sigma factor